MRLLLSALFVLWLVGCAHVSPAPVERAPLLLISVDGLRPSDVTPEQMPNLSRFADAGVRASEGMRPSYPSLTFPNHYTLVTGLRPDHHGIVHNSMRDAVLGKFRISDRTAVGNGAWWGDEPAWIGAKKAGLHTATLYWPGSEAAIGGVHPDRWEPYDETTSAASRVEKVAGWLREPAATRPDFATLYFHRVDEAQHHDAPGSAEAREALHDTDDAFGLLLQRLRESGMEGRINIVLVSDHGFATVPNARAIAVESMAPLQEAEAVSVGQVVTFVPKPGFEQQAAKRLLGRHANYQCWRKQDLPARWHYGTHPRVPPIVCQMDEGWDALPETDLAKRDASHDRGSHGFDPALPSMRATFIANGPAFRHGYHVPLFDNVDVYPLLMRLLRAPAAPNDGNPDTLKAVLAPGY